MSQRRGISVQDKKTLLKSFDSLPNASLMSQREAALRLNISQATLSRVLKNRYEIESASSSDENLSRKRKKSGKDEDVEKVLKKWFVKVREKKAPINGPLLKIKAETLAEKLGKKNFKATDGWLSRWRSRENIVYRKIHGEQGEADTIGANHWLTNEWPKLHKEYRPNDIFNADETGLYFRALPEHTYALKSENTNEFKISKQRITVLCCASMSDREQNVIANDIAKKTSLLDGLHQVNQAWSYVSSETIKNCYRKAGFVKDAKDIPSNVSNVDSIEIYPQDMPNEEFDEWINIDENLQTSVKPTDDDICQEAIQTESEDEDDDNFEPAPTSTEMFNALQAAACDVGDES
ncbi:tigger transposable element-derived protein 6-like [Trichogramma pretiosum]|uniref:tigger transposable element-derived protein 6-like n=1 Tax=Trichogramma pretiosum TaxID=7493 RepID=UPI000C71AA30|nr:tigger transposable element-derived protein 6-like [Trichogramma pretiosum]